MREFSLKLSASDWPVVRAGVGNLRLAFALGAYFALFNIATDHGYPSSVGAAAGMLAAAVVVVSYLRLVVECRLTEEAVQLVLPIGRVSYDLGELSDIVLRPHTSYSGCSLTVFKKGTANARTFSMLTSPVERERVLGEMVLLIAEFKNRGLLDASVQGRLRRTRR